MPWFPTATDYQKTGFYTFVEPRKGLGNEACPKWNPQSEFTSDEDKSQSFKILELCTPKRNGDTGGGFVKQSA